MFSLDTWVQNINLTETVMCGIEGVNSGLNILIRSQQIKGLGTEIFAQRLLVTHGLSPASQIGIGIDLLVIAFRVRSGHIPLNKFAFMMKKVTSPNCSVCDKIEDVYHILVECVRNESTRNNILSSTSISDMGRCNSILAFPHSPEAVAFYKLVKMGLESRST